MSTGNMSALPSASDWCESMSAVAEFLKNHGGLFKCDRMNAGISKKQCDINRHSQPAGPNRMAIKACLSCEGCPGLSEEITELKEAPVAKMCSVKGCDHSVHARGMCWKHERSELGVNPANGMPVKPKTTMAPLAAVGDQDSKQVFSPVTEGKRTITATDVKALSGASRHATDSAMACEIDALFTAKRTEWLADLVGATSERSRAKMFLAMADVLEGLVY